MSNEWSSSSPTVEVDGRGINHQYSKFYRFEAGFRANSLSYLLVLRLIPIFPFWLVNLVAGALALRLWVFVLGTFFGGGTFPRATPWANNSPDATSTANAVAFMASSSVQLGRGE